MTLAQALVARSVDVAIVWDTTVSQINSSMDGGDSDLLKIALVLSDSNEGADISVGVVANRAGENSKAFQAYLVESKTSRDIFRSFGFRVPNESVDK